MSMDGTLTHKLEDPQVFANPILKFLTDVDAVTDGESLSYMLLGNPCFLLERVHLITRSTTTAIICFIQCRAVGMKMRSQAGAAYSGMCSEICCSSYYLYWLFIFSLQNSCTLICVELDMTLCRCLCLTVVAADSCMAQCVWFCWANYEHIPYWPWM